LPAPPLRARVVAAALVALVAAGVGGLAVQTGLSLGFWYPVKAAGGLAAGLVVVFGGLRRHHPHPTFGPANMVTLARAVLVALLAALAGESMTTSTAMGAVVLASTAIALDGIDGWFARRYRTASAFGARFDMEVDALLVLVLALLVWSFGKAGAWVLTSGLLRYGFVAAGTMFPWLAGPLPPRRRRQAVCVVQLIGLTVALAPFIRPPLSAVLAAIALAALVGSFASDLAWLVRRRSVAIPGAATETDHGI